MVSLVSLGFSLKKHFFEPVIYVDNLYLYAQYNYSKKVENELNSLLKLRKGIGDSLQAKIAQVEDEIGQVGKPDEGKLAGLSEQRQSLVYKLDDLQREDQLIVNEYRSKVWKRINDAVSSYGKEKGCRLILGANGQGNLMYGDESVDKTEEVLEFINKLFDGEK